MVGRVPGCSNAERPEYGRKIALPTRKGDIPVSDGMDRRRLAGSEQEGEGVDQRVGRARVEEGAGALYREL